jgi:hypothetical protein
MEWFVYAVGFGLGSSILFFPLTSMAMRKSYGYKFTDGRHIVLFLLSAPIIGISQVIINPPGSPLSLKEIVSTFAVPVIVSAILIHIAYRKKFP